MESQLIGAKRKGEDLEQDQPQKKSKISVNLTHDPYVPNLSQLIDLPEDCWRAISEYLTLDTASGLYYASKSFRQVHGRLVAHYYNRFYGLPMDLAPLLPTSVTKRTSRLDIIFLFEQAIALAEAQDYSDLAKVLKRIKLRAEMIQTVFIVLNTMPKNLIDERHLKSVFYSDFYRNLQELPEHEDSDETADVSQKSAFIWIGKDRRYIDVKCEYHDLYLRSYGKGWLEFNITVVLKQLGVENTGETILFRFKKDPADFTESHTIEQCIFTNDSYEKEKFFNDEDVRKIMDWLKVDLIGNENSPKAFMNVLLNLAVNQQIHIIRDEERQALEYENIKFDEYDTYRMEDVELEELTEKYNEEIKEFNGDIVKEISHLMRYFLSGAKNWIEKAQFVVKRLLLKLDFIRVIQEANISSEEAKNELIDLFARATLDCCQSHTADYFVQATRNSWASFVSYIETELRFNLQPKDESTFSFGTTIFYEKSPRTVYSSYSIEMRFDRHASELRFEYREELKQKFDRTGFYDNMLSKMNLKHVTSKDWYEFFLQFTNPSNAGELD